jgi:hypothetical protein
MNRDYKVDLSDFSILSSNYNTGPGKSYNQGDLNGDGYVNVNDYSILSANYLDDVLPAGDFDDNLFVNGDDFKRLLQIGRTQ